MRIEAGSRSRDHVARDVNEVGVRMVLPPHIEEDRLYIRAARQGLDHGLALPTGQLLGNSRWKLAGILLGEIFEECERQIRRLWLWRGGILLDPIRHFGFMALGPLRNVRGMRRGSAHPRLRELIMVISPLRHYVWIALEAVLLKPGFDVGRDELPLFRPTRVLDDRAERPRYSITK